MNLHDIEDQYDAKTAAVCAHFRTDPETLAWDGDRVTLDGEEWLVFTDEEADAAANEALDEYLDDCLLSELPEIARHYFDCEAWKRDALISDGRGHVLASYDSNEIEVKVNGEWYYMYRIG